MIDIYWDKAIKFETYIDKVLKISLQETTENRYSLSFNRMKYIMSNYIPDVNQEFFFNEKKFKGKILIIAEGWCGDCSQSVPVVQKFFENKTPVRIILRDETPDLMKMFLTNGNSAIPIVIFINENNKIIAHWGPRTKFGKEILSNHKKDPKKFKKEDFLSDLHNYYDNNKGYDIINEILSIL